MVDASHLLGPSAVATICGSTLFIMRDTLINTNQATISQLQGELHALGIRAADTLMVHTSLRSVGPVEDRSQGVISAPIGVLGSDGTLMAYADFEPTSEVPYFDIRRSPAQRL